MVLRHASGHFQCTNMVSFATTRSHTHGNRADYKVKGLNPPPQNRLLSEQRKTLRLLQ